MENRELFFEHEIDTEVFDSAFTEMLLGPKYRADACWKAFVDQCYANGSSSFDADIVFHVSFEHCDHARCSSAARRLVRMNVIELSSTKVRLRFRHFDMEGGRYSLPTVCEREVLCLRDFDSYSRPRTGPLRFSTSCGGSLLRRGKIALAIGCMRCDKCCRSWCVGAKLDLVQWKSSPKYPSVHIASRDSVETLEFSITNVGLICARGRGLMPLSDVAAIRTGSHRPIADVK
jgi:hypothetical protein